MLKWLSLFNIASISFFNQNLTDTLTETENNTVDWEKSDCVCVSYKAPGDIWEKIHYVTTT